MITRVEHVGLDVKAAITTARVDIKLVQFLSRGFQASRGSSIGAYVARHQLARAKHLLQGDASVAAIAQSLGFSSASNFCFAFRRTMGLSPGQYRRSVAGGATREMLD